MGFDPVSGQTVVTNHMIGLDMDRVKVYNAAQIKLQEVFTPVRVVYEMIKFKVCPRCHGDLYLNEDVFGKYLNCLQCGYMKDSEAPAPTRKETERKMAATAGREAA